MGLFDKRSGDKKSSGGSKKKWKGSSNDYTTVNLTIYYFRGEPDSWFRRHVVLAVSSLELGDNFESVHVQRLAEDEPWNVERITQRKDWFLSRTYLGHIHAGSVNLRRGSESIVTQVMASTPVEGNDPNWNCQHFMFDGLQALVNEGYQTQGWLEEVRDNVMDRLLEGNAG